MPKPSPTRYRTTNWADYNAALRKRGSLSVWFDPEMVWHADKTGKRGRPETFGRCGSDMPDLEGVGWGTVS